MQPVGNRRRNSPEYVGKITLYLVADGLIEGEKGNLRFRGTPEEWEIFLRNEFANHVLNKNFFSNGNGAQHENL